MELFLVIKIQLYLLRNKMDLQIIDIKGKDTGKKLKLSKDVFEVEPNDHAIYLDVKQYLAANRQGTHKAKERADISGSTRKIKKQKGTGSARAGSIKSPIFRGGGRVFGPRPRDYDFKLNKKVKSIARKSALSYKAKEKAIVVLNEFGMKDIKTSQYVEVLKNLKLDNSKTLVILGESNDNVFLSSRNIENTRVVLAETLCTYDVMNSDTLIAEEGAIKIIEERLN